MTIDTEFEISFYYSDVLACIGCCLACGQFTYTGFGPDCSTALSQAIRCIDIHTF